MYTSQHLRYSDSWHLAGGGFLIWLWLLAAPCFAGDLTGSMQSYEVRQEDTLYDIARRFDLGVSELFAANRTVDRWQPAPGITVIIPGLHILPTVRKGIVINVRELRLYYFGKNGLVRTFPVGAGTLCCPTPVGRTHIRARRRHPVWYPPPSVRAEKPDLPASVPPGPGNPMGEYALYLTWPGYAIHGTNRPWSIGRPVSHGCIRMYPEDIEQLYSMVATDEPVLVIEESIALGWHEDTLYFAAFPSPLQAEALAQGLPLPLEPIDDLQQKVLSFVGKTSAAGIDWYSVEKEAMERSGIPIPILHKTAEE